MTYIIFLFFAAAFFIPFNAYGQGYTLDGRIVSIADGDTVTLLDAGKRQHKIRLSGIDAPERKQAFGHRSREHLDQLVLGKQVTTDCRKTDRYKRAVCKIKVDGIDANLAQVAAGMAWHYREYEREQSLMDRLRYAHAENRAQEERRGLWADRAPVAPWDFRRAAKRDAAGR
ncbi:nuclease (SNase domain protein) (plasmid) [Thauera aminoaromatica]|uniref:Nuclease (SNase domain protein) n=1 Tax=Thauera aminoaromatica TaxID=164330 RepID=B8F0D3_THASP|nr:nuclease (SNase domain protein) [Thauera aminoaromatica]